MQDMMNTMMDSGGSGFAWLWMLTPLLFWGSLLALVVWVVVRIFPAHRSQPEASPNTPEEILRERFARGEIDTKEYERSLATVRGRSDRRPHENLD